MNRPSACTYLLYVLLDPNYLYVPMAFHRRIQVKPMAFHRRIWLWDHGVSSLKTPWINPYLWILLAGCVAGSGAAQGNR